MKPTDPRTDPRYMRDPRGYGYRRIEDVLRDAAREEREAHERNQRTAPDPRWLEIARAYVAAPVGKRRLRPTAESVAGELGMSADTLALRLRDLGILDFRDVHRRMGR